MGQGYSRVGQLPDGTWSVCKAKPENVGIRCPHIDGSHMGHVSKEQLESLNEQAYQSQYEGTRSLRKHHQSDTLSNPVHDRLMHTIDFLNEHDTDGMDLTEIRTQAAKLHLQELEDESNGQEQSWASAEVLSTVRQSDGGGTWNPMTQKMPTCGFCYSPYPEHSKCLKAEEITLKELNDYAKEHHDLLGKDHHFVGLWNNPADGNVYLDISVNTMDAGTAKDGCENHDQIAYFDLQTFTSVEVDANATSGQSEKPVDRVDVKNMV